MGYPPNDIRVQVFEMFGADIGLTTKHVLKIMAEADDNGNGAIEYKECEFWYYKRSSYVEAKVTYVLPCTHAQTKGRRSRQLTKVFALPWIFTRAVVYHCSNRQRHFGVASR